MSNYLLVSENVFWQTTDVEEFLSRRRHIHIEEEHDRAFQGYFSIFNHLPVTGEAFAQ
jgi:hypothetical protein